MTMVVSVLLYGSECWALSKTDKNRLNVFHRRCVRTMTGTSKRRQWKRRIKSAELDAILQLETMEFYLRRRALRWLGHVVRMDYDRVPRKMLFGWVDNARKRGGQKLTYGRRVLRLVCDALTLTTPEIRRTITGTSLLSGLRAAAAAVAPSPSSSKKKKKKRKKKRKKKKEKKGGEWEKFAADRCCALLIVGLEGLVRIFNSPVFSSSQFARDPDEISGKSDTYTFARSGNSAKAYSIAAFNCFFTSERTHDVL